MESVELGDVLDRALVTKCHLMSLLHTVEGRDRSHSHRPWSRNLAGAVRPVMILGGKGRREGNAGNSQWESSKVSHGRTGLRRE